MPFLLLGLTAQTAWAQTPVTVNYTAIPSFSIQPVLDFGGVTVTGSDDIAVAPNAGVAVSGGPTVLATDAGETIQFSFNGGAAINVTYNNNNVGGIPGSGVGFGAAIVEGFDVGGTSLGTFVGCCFGIIDVSTPFGNVPLSRFTATGIVPVGGEPSFFRTGSLTYTPVDPVLPVNIDIKFCSDPNAFNCRKKGVLPVTIFGTASFDALDIDPSTLQLCLADESACTNGPIDWSIADRGDPTSDLGAAMCAIDSVTGLELHFLNPDTFPDFDAAFEASEVQAMLGVFCGGPKNGVSPTLVITGSTFGGIPRPISSAPIGSTGIDQLVKKGK